MYWPTPFQRGAGRPGVIIPIYFLLLCSPCSSQEIFRGTEALSLGGHYTILPAPAPGANQAILGLQEQGSLSLSAWQPFIIPGIQVAGLNTVFRLAPGYLGLALTSWGMKAYHRSAIWLTYGMKLGQNLSAGIAFRSDLVSANGELAYRWRVSVSGGLIWQISNSLTAGLHLSDPLSVANFQTPLAPLPSMLSLGTTYIPTPGLRLFLQYACSSYSGNRLSLGCSWQLNESIALRTGWSSNPLTSSFGAGFCLQAWMIQFALPWVTGRGISPSVTMTRTFSGK